ncbi:MAG TPA: two-component regulator propeller domain-containing protein [Bacteroidales bacterium]|jgi:ligand-binding sensor domain-containing protein/serine phosphatase RsbU (regulator of sigma subunit)|nr:two-component regulator propeller domain-containing protein [Bacteroidales bacterium]
MPGRTKLLLATITLLICISGIQSQEYRISNFGTNEGILHPFVYTINQDNKGYIWIGTGEGICRFNGFSFITDEIQDTLKGQVAAVSFKDSKNNLWFGYQNGGIAFYNGREFSLLNTGKLINSAITGIAELAEGNILISTLNNGVICYDGKEPLVTEGPEQRNYTAVCVKGNTLLLGSQEGLSVYSIDNTGKKATSVITIKEFEFSRIPDIQPSSEKHSYWVAAEDLGPFKLTLDGENYKLLPVAEKLGLGNERVQSVYEDIENQLWISTYNGVFRLSELDEYGGYQKLERYSSGNGLSGDRAKRVFQDLEGNIWIATYGDGLSMLTGQPMVFSEFEYPGLENNINCVAVAEDGTEYIGGNGGLYRINKEKEIIPRRISNIPSSQITTLLLDGTTLYIGTETNGFFVLNTTNNQVRKVDYEAYSMGNWVSAIALGKQYIYLATKDGIYRFTRDFSKVTHYTTTNGMPHNNIEHIIVDSKDRLLIATKASGIYTISEEGEVSNAYATGTEIDFKSVAEDENGGIWAGTYGDGVIYFRDDSIYQFTQQSGLKANFCYSIVPDHRGSIWVGHRLGLSRININNMLISVYDQHMGMSGDCNPNAVSSTKSGQVYFGTTSGMISYDPSRENKKQLAPFTNIVSLTISDKPYDFTRDIVLPYKIYQMRIEFIGLNYSDPQAVRYQYKLEGYDIGWSDVSSQTSVSYPRIEDGDYTFYIRSYNSEGLSQEIPVSFHLKVKPPVWKTWWFIGLLILIIAASLFLIIKYRERKQRQLQEYLERELKARTKEVVEQKEEIEIKNRDITDSINYAKRIQTSMLPPVRRLQQHFSGSFVFYSPRDIVSGDFYWFDKINDSKFVIVCADSTGHGVPGAFMSMIGSTLIKDICNRESGNSPSKVLQVLDCELRNTLNQNLDDGTKPGDGMDIIVCEIDLKTHYVRYASAMRPMIIYKNGEEIFVKGSRNSVGGHYDKEENLFEDEGLQLGKGDIIYMFSDGYSDQFGGPMGKKFKMIRLKNLLQDIHTKPMDEQCLHVKNTFNLWKENFDQVDDVLFMGIKI